MKTNHLFASAAVAAVLVMTAPAHAQLLGGGARGGAGGAFAGSFGAMGGMGGMNGRMSAASDASLRGGLHTRRAVDRSGRTAATAGAQATGAADAAAHAGFEKGETLARGGVASTATDVREAGKVSPASTTSSAGGQAAGAASAGGGLAAGGAPGGAFSGSGGAGGAGGAAGATRNPHPSNRPGNTGHDGGAAPVARGYSAGGNGQAQQGSDIATNDVSASASADAQASASASH